MKTIEVRGVNFKNKGAELMLLSIAEHYKKSAEISLPINPSTFNTAKRKEYNLFGRISAQPKGIDLDTYVNLLPSILRKSLKLKTTENTDLILDASGFAYSDQWGSEGIKVAAEKYTSWKKKGKKIVLLPQAFGPFEKNNSSAHLKKLTGAVDLIYARDTQSLKYLLDLCEDSSKIKLSPDITIGLEISSVKSRIEIPAKSIAIIPNYRIIDKSSTKPETYVEVLTASIKLAMEKGYTPYIVIHEGNKDLELGNILRKNIGLADVPIIVENNPLQLKKLLGEFTFVISSRFHGIVNALSQGIPCMAIGWSHKYPLLLKDFDFQEGMLDLSVSPSEVIRQVDSLLSENPAIYKNRIEHNASNLKAKVAKMWAEVDTLL